MKSFFLITIILMNLYTCKSQEISSISGNVYVADELIKNRKVSYDSFPIIAFRIDTIIANDLFVKYRFGSEHHMDIDFIYDDNCSCFKSKGMLLLAPNGSIKIPGYLKVLNEDNIELNIIENNIEKKYLYRKTYRDTIDFKKSRNIYYAEDGFPLFKRS